VLEGESEGCGCWCCGYTGLEAEVAQRKTRLLCVPPSGYEEAQEDYEHHRHTPTDNTTKQEIESTHQQKHPPTQNEESACWYCGGEVPDGDSEAAGEGEEKAPGCVACFKRSAMCFLPRSARSTPCRGMIC
jgi:hypothetical protein